MPKTHKNCKNCWKEFKILSFAQADCSPACHSDRKSKNIGNKKQTPLKSNKKGLSKKIKEWKVRGVSELVKLKVYTRDNWSCVLCWDMKWLEGTPHHVRFWVDKYDLKWEERNTERNLVTICMKDHEQIHGWMLGKWQEYTERCKTYLDNLYDNG